MAMEVEQNQNHQLGFPFWKPLRRRFGPESPFFAHGNLERELLAKQLALELTEEKQQLEKWMQEEEGRLIGLVCPFLLIPETWPLASLFVGNLLLLSNSSSIARQQSIEMAQQAVVGEVFCPIVGCGARLTSMEDFENHYNARHTASCSVCSRVYPTSWLLSIHVSEVHDSFFQAKVARGYDMYECLVERCGLKFKSYNSRQQHLVDKHKFPTSFEFFKKAKPSKKHRLKSQRKQAVCKEDSSGMMEVENASMDDLVSAVSKLNTSDSTPSSISFGRRHKGLSFVPRAVQRGGGSNSTASVTKK
ncbi:Zinc finger protein 511 [Glycine max]|nr:Zinc finger protein 511 [Glycine max]